MRLPRDHRNNSAEMARPKPPEVEVRNLITFPFDDLTHSFGHLFVRCHVEQNRPGIADQAVGPACDDAGTHDAGDRVHPEPAEGAGKQETDNDKDRNGGIRHDDLARQIGEAGNLNKLGQAREGAFSVELGAQLADSRLQGRAEKERLTRLLGLWGKEIAFRLPKGLPSLPRKITTEPHVEAQALRERVDLKAGREDLAATAAELGLTNATRFVTDVTLALQDDRERNNGSSGSNLGSDTNTRLVRRGFSLDFEIPIYDFGESKVRSARETYLAAANRLAQRAIEARSQARETYTRYRGKYDLARYYADRVLPLRKTILDETTLQTNGMLVDVTQLIIDGRARITSNVAAIGARRDFFLATVDLKAALVGGGGLGGRAAPQAAAMPGTGEAAN